MAIDVNKKEREIEIAAILNKFAYLDYNANKDPKDIIGIRLGDLHSDYASTSAASLTLISTSRDEGYPPEMLNAYTFKDEETGTIYVAYRGTGDGKWVDNGRGITEYSPMQRAAAGYFDKVVENHNISASNNIVVSGHSKGGNSAQVATILSNNRALISACYSMDGQGMSAAAIKEAMRMSGIADYNRQIDKMVSINELNDYVHPLGIGIIPSSQTYTLTQGDHNPYQLFNRDGSLAWTKDANENIVHGTPGNLTKAMNIVSKAAQLLPLPLQSALAVDIMGMFECFSGSEHKVGTGPNDFLIQLYSLLAPLMPTFGLLCRFSDIQEIKDLFDLAAMMKAEIANQGQGESSFFHGGGGIALPAGSGTTTLVFDSAKIKLAVTEMRNHNNSMNGTLQKAEEAVNLLGKDWDGGAGDAMRTRFKRLADRFPVIYKDINEYAAFLEKAVAAYELTEKEITGSAETSTGSFFK